VYAARFRICECKREGGGGSCVLPCYKQPPAKASVLSNEQVRLQPPNSQLGHASRKIDALFEACASFRSSSR